MISRKKGFLMLQTSCGLKKQLLFASALFVAIFCRAEVTLAQPANGANKFLGNITTRNAIPANFMTYWNHITPENEGKWAVVEGVRGKYSWDGVDSIKNFAERNNIPWKFHTLVWGSACQSWLMSLSLDDQLKALGEWMDEAAKRYPNVPMIDVVNEASPTHAPAPYKAALGGDGVTGFDWIINAFVMARKRWPKALLIYNDYSNIEYDQEVTWTCDLINAMKAANAPIDAIGCEAHYAYTCSTSVLENNINKLAETGLPIFITEYDIDLQNDSLQQKIMEEQFPLFWNHPKIVGITFWGYVVGSTWRSGTGLITSTGIERPALAWVKKYVQENLSPPNDFAGLIALGGVGILPQNGSTGSSCLGTASAGRANTGVYDLRGRVLPLVQGRVSANSVVVKGDGKHIRITNRRK